ncbi:hypothetical protein PLESTB_001603800 [Pleodorina starrii]|uniref:CAAX prenyl protease 2/Lysostaphin resistance protein A-like domain-containing protein n=1 Tax=Pleodorina starrii TaxID=330485 RepID=A0A9W6F8K3_9CHLO|nr:hypothetical protein PLESTB_001603800 [Pleodorina starrii]
MNTMLMTNAMHLRPLCPRAERRPLLPRTTLLCTNITAPCRASSSGSINLRRKAGPGLCAYAAKEDRQSAAGPPHDGPPGPDSPGDDASPTTSAAASTTADSALTAPPPLLSPSVLVSEVMSGQLLANAKRVFPKVPWGPSQLAQVMGWSAALAVLSATTAATTPQASALLASDEIRSAAVRHLGLETLCCCLAVAVLFMGLRRSKPRSAGLFKYDMDPKLALAVAALAAVSYPLADPVLHSIWSDVEKATGLSAYIPDPGVGLVTQLRGCVEAGDGLSIAMHLAASCVVGPLWEETFWRGFFLASMTRVLPLPGCVALSSLSFAALHLGPGNLLPIAALSAACDALYLRTGSLAAPLAFHAGWNAYQLAGILLVGKDSFV